MKVEKFIAFQTVDRAGDVYGNTAFLFKSEKDALAFFSNPKLVIDTLGYEVKEYEDVNECVKVITNLNGDSISTVVINLEYCGNESVLQMRAGFVITAQNKLSREINQKMQDLSNTENLIGLQEKLNEFAVYHQNKGGQDAHRLIKSELMDKRKDEPNDSLITAMLKEEGYKLAIKDVLALLRKRFVP